MVLTSILIRTKYNIGFHVLSYYIFYYKFKIFLSVYQMSSNDESLKKFEFNFCLEPGINKKDMFYNLIIGIPYGATLSPASFF